MAESNYIERFEIAGWGVWNEEAGPSEPLAVFRTKPDAEDYARNSTGRAVLPVRAAIVFINNRLYADSHYAIPSPIEAD
jgi:hypothetical protein